MPDTSVAAASDYSDSGATQQRPPQQPVVTFLVPCYNSAAYMGTCIDSLLVAKDCCEILIVNDGSKDNTLEVARDYERRYPDTITVIDQENAGWGGGVNKGIARARGVYFKVIDSDDWVEPEALGKVLDVLKEHAEPGTQLDLVFSNFVYDHLVDNTKHAIRYDNLMPQDREFTWSDLNKPRIDQYIMVHATWYRTEVLRQSGVKLPENVCYMDSYLMLHPLPHVKSMYYVNADVYQYLIGREDQSIGIETVKKRIDQQLMATRLSIEDYDIDEMAAENPQMAELYSRYISAMMSTSTIYLFMINTPESLQKNDKLWDYMKTKNPGLYKRVARSLAGLANRKHAPIRKGVIGAYWLAKKIFKFA